MTREGAKVFESPRARLFARNPAGRVGVARLKDGASGCKHGTQLPPWLAETPTPQQLPSRRWQGHQLCRQLNTSNEASETGTRTLNVSFPFWFTLKMLIYVVIPLCSQGRSWKFGLLHFFIHDENYLIICYMLYSSLSRPKLLIKYAWHDRCCKFG